MPDTATFRGSREDLRRFLRDLPKLLSGAVPDPFGIAREIQLRIGITLLSLIQTDFLLKASGQKGEDGIQWKTLSPITIANRRRGPGDKKAVRALKKARNLNSPANKKKRQALYNQKLTDLLLGGVAPRNARAMASKYADQMIRGDRQKLPTVFQFLSQREVQILIDTAALLASFSPGQDATPSGAPGQIFRINPGEIVVGTNVKTWHHLVKEGRRLLRRPFWPDNGELPARWWAALMAAATTGLQEALKHVVESGAIRKGA